MSKICKYTPFYLYRWDKKDFEKKNNIFRKYNFLSILRAINLTMENNSEISISFWISGDASVPLDKAQKKINVHAIWN